MSGIEQQNGVAWRCRFHFQHDLPATLVQFTVETCLRHEVLENLLLRLEADKFSITGLQDSHTPPHLTIGLLILFPNLLSKDRDLLIRADEEDLAETLVGQQAGRRIIFEL